MLRGRAPGENVFRVRRGGGRSRGLSWKPGKESKYFYGIDFSFLFFPFLRDSFWGPCCSLPGGEDLFVAWMWTEIWTLTQHQPFSLEFLKCLKCGVYCRNLGGINVSEIVLKWTLCVRKRDFRIYFFKKLKFHTDKRIPSIQILISVDKSLHNE